MNNIKKNFIYNISYQILILIIPLISMPYVSRILGTDGVGEYSYTYSIVYYFMIFSMLGLNNYGNRSIARVRDDKKKLSKTFREIHLVQIISTLIMTMLYIGYIIIFSDKFFRIYVCQIFYILSCFFDINWFFFGIEEFKLTVTRNTIIKILSLIFIFIFVKKSSDVWKYALILSFSTFISQIFLWPFVKKYTISVKIRMKDMIKHVLPCIKLFLPVIAVSVYKIMDKTMIGFLSTVREVGLYENAEKIIGVPIAIITAFGTVMLPRMSNLYSNNRQLKDNSLIIEKSMKIIMFLSISMMFGLLCVSRNFSTLFFGKNFYKTGTLIMCLSSTIVFFGWGNVIRTQYLIPKGKDKEYIISAFLGAIVNFIINFILIPRYSSIGACYGTIIAEFIVVVYQTYSVKDVLPIKKYLSNTIYFFISGLIMFIFTYPISYLKINSYLMFFVQLIIGSFIYVILNAKFIFSFIKFKFKIFKR